MTTLSTPAEVAAWERAYDAAIAAGMQESAGTFADRKIVELRKRQGAPERCCAGCEAPIHGKSIDANDEEGVLATWHPECAPRNEKPSPPVARERLGRKKLTDWLEMSVTGVYMSMVRDDPHDVRMRANDDGSWFVLDGDHRVIASGIATLGTFPTLLAAAQHAADSSAEARERYEWDGQEYPVCADCDRPATHNEALIFAAGVGRDARWVHDPVCPRETIPAPTTPDHLADAGKKVAPTRAEVEAAILAWVNMRRPRLMALPAFLGWTHDEWTAYDLETTGSGTIPARPLKVHAEKPRQYSDSNSLQSDFAAAALERSRYALAENERARAAQLDAVPTPVTDTLSPANGIRASDAVRAAGRERAGNRLVDAWDRLSNDLQSIEAHNEMEAAVSTAVAALIATK